MGAWKDLGRIEQAISKHVSTCPHCFLAVCFKNDAYTCETGRNLRKYYLEAQGMFEPEPTVEEWFYRGFGFLPSRN